METKLVNREFKTISWMYSLIVKGLIKRGLEAIDLKQVLQSNLCCQSILNMNQFSSASEHEEDDRSSENELSDDDSFIAMAVVAVAVSRHNRRRDPQPMHNSSLTATYVWKR